MRTEREIRQHLDETEDPIVERTLAWVLTSNDSPCPMCANPHHKVWEVKIMTGQITPIHLET